VLFILFEKEIKKLSNPGTRLFPEMIVYAVMRRIATVRTTAGSKIPTAMASKQDPQGYGQQAPG
jgi:hypothetical protein